MKNGWVKKTVVTAIILVIGGYLGYVTKVQFAIAEHVITNDKASRQRDTDIQREAIKQERMMNKSLNEIKTTQSTNHTELLLAIERLKPR